MLLRAGRAEDGLCLLEQTAADGLLDESAAITRATQAELTVAVGALRGEVLHKVALMPAAWTFGEPDHPEV